ncbi:putative cell wall glucanase (Scw4) [Aspergillus saccharolyticus JOP 1030-1]|uniref:Glycoside hydrolase n=1 Tax=Aspergillus saccharolyticus JOP 1030-1 TaxID=1450539 RepID=A0A318ZGY6_9EURO|nr:glycoside hydrolase [Aspergillus saccharolyticus JOP 1030-1]PYH46821.1 glycoside hydrolase [Aspergillus saccharolyticus JOP 1030-1]
MQWTPSQLAAAAAAVLLLSSSSSHSQLQVTALPTGNLIPNPFNGDALSWLDQSADQLSSGVVHGLNAAIHNSDGEPTPLSSIPYTPPPSANSNANANANANANSASNDKSYGIAYSPYNPDGTCKTSPQITHDITKLSSFRFVRIYGTDCNQTHLVLSAAQPLGGLQVFAGLFDLHDLDEQLQLIIDAVHANPAANNNPWQAIHTVAIGNELLNRAQATAAEVVAAVQSARETLRAAGYHGPVVTVDTVAAHLQNPELCRVSDYCAANCHAFFDETVPAEAAGDYVWGQVGVGAAAAPPPKRKKVLITESGWPHAGQTNGMAVPSLENQKAAVQSLRDAFALDPSAEDEEVRLVLFSSFDDLWKVDNGYTFGAEKFWGILGH